MIRLASLGAPGMGLEPECIVQVKLLFKVIHGPTLCLYLTLRCKVKGGSAAKDIFFKIFGCKKVEADQMPSMSALS